MKKQIGIDELQLGMQIEQLDRSWLDTPFFRHKMTITSTTQIAQLKACGVHTLVVSMDVTAVEEEEPVSEPDIATDPLLTAAEAPPSGPPASPFEEELPTARQISSRQNDRTERHARHEIGAGNQYG